MALLIFVSGHVADRFDRRRVAALCQLIQMLGAASLATASILHALTPGLIYALIALLGAARAFEGPCMQALLPSLVPRALFSHAAALSSSLLQTATIVGPALGGLLYGAGAAIPYLACAGLFAAASICLILVPRGAPPPPREPVSPRAVFGGLVFIRERPELLGAISLDLFAVLLGGATALLPVYARDILHAGPSASACCAQPRHWARYRSRCCWPGARSHAMPARICSPPWRCSGWPPSASACRARCRSRSRRWRCWAARMWSAW